MLGGDRATLLYLFCEEAKLNFLTKGFCRSTPVVR